LASFEAQPDEKYNYQIVLGDTSTEISQVPDYLNTYQRFRMRLSNLQQKNNGIEKATVGFEIASKTSLKELTIKDILLHLYSSSGERLDTINFMEALKGRTGLSQLDIKQADQKVLLMLAAGDYNVELDSSRYGTTVNKIVCDFTYYNGDVKANVVMYDNGKIIEGIY